MESEKVLVKVDKNGSKYYKYEAPCDRCGGKRIYYTGIMNGKLVPANPDSGVCWKCGGTGFMTVTEIERTPEHEEELNKQRLKRQLKNIEITKEKSAKRNKETFEKFGFNVDGEVWMVLGNTYEIRDEIKRLGGKFDNVLGWHFNYDCKEFDCYKFNVDELLDVNYNGEYYGYSDESLGKVREVKDEYDANKRKDIVPQCADEYIGNVGDKVTLGVTLLNSFSFDTDFGVTTIYKFADEENHIIVWKTSNYIDADNGSKVILSGKIKAHNEYKGEKQTVLTRCRVELA